MNRIICGKPTGEIPLCYRPDCGQPGTVQCDYPVDRWGRTCGRHACTGHSEMVDWNRDYCQDHAAARKVSPPGGTGA